MLALVVPTRGTHPELLERLLASSGLPLAQVFLVRTSPSAQMPAGPVVLDDFAPVNIQRWWNLGIREAQRHGATMVAVANDDIRIGTSTLQQLARGLAAARATIATPGSRLRLHRSPWTVQRRLDGALWLLSLVDDLRPDESFRWGYGDDDLDLRARRHYRGVLTVPVEYEHVHHNSATQDDHSLQRLSQSDAALFRHRYPMTALARTPRSMARQVRSRAAR